MYSCIVICQAYMLLKLYHHFSSEALEKTQCRRESLSGTRRKPRQDEDGDEAHEFLVEDEESKTDGRMDGKNRSSGNWCTSSLKILETRRLCWQPDLQ